MASATPPDLWTDEFAFLINRFQVYIQSDLFYYLPARTSTTYPKWQAWMRDRRRGCR